MIYFDLISNDLSLSLIYLISPNIHQTSPNQPPISNHTHTKESEEEEEEKT
jgi:hypothetical protein